VVYDAYEPIRDGNGKTIGMLYFGVKQEAVEGLRNSIMSTKVGKTGYVYVLGGQGEQKGTYIISKDGARDGENIWDAKDADGKPFIQSIVNGALSVKPGEVTYQRYPWLNQGDTKARVKIAAVTYFEPYDWVIGAGSYEDDYRDAKGKVESALAALLLWSVIGGVAVVACAAVFAFKTGKAIGRPLAEIATASNRLAFGDLNQTISHRSSDDVGYLAEAFRQVIEGLKIKAAAATEIARGNVDANVVPLCDEDVLGQATLTMKNSIASMMKDVESLVQAAVAGDLTKRADAARTRASSARSSRASTTRWTRW